MTHPPPRRRYWIASLFPKNVTEDTTVEADAGGSYIKKDEEKKAPEFRPHASMAELPDAIAAWRF